MVERIFILFAVMLFVHCELIAKKVEGEIVIGDDTLKVIVRAPLKFLSQKINYESLQERLVYFDKDGKRKVLKPTDADEYSFMCNYEFVRMISVKNNLALGNLLDFCPKIFLLIEIDGPVRLFSYYFMHGFPAEYNSSTRTFTEGQKYSVEKYILQKNGEDMVRPRSLTFRKDMTQYFSDCPELSRKIENREFTKRDLRVIVSYYNRRCK